MTEHDPLAVLRVENARLVTLLERNGIDWRMPQQPSTDPEPSGAPRVLLTTGKLIGEGFDHPPHDTLVLAMPISWKDTLQQYAGRLNREHAGKADVRIIDFVDTGHPALLRMWDKRQRGYRMMGYRMAENPALEPCLD